MNDFEDGDYIVYMPWSDVDLPFINLYVSVNKRAGLIRHVYGLPNNSFVFDLTNFRKATPEEIAACIAKRMTS